MARTEEDGLMWILANYRHVKLQAIYVKLKTILGDDFADEETDIESAMSERLGRRLSDDERFRLRPVAMEIYANYYGEE